MMICPNCGSADVQERGPTAGGKKVAVCNKCSFHHLKSQFTDHRSYPTGNPGGMVKRKPTLDEEDEK